MSELFEMELEPDGLELEPEPTPVVELTPAPAFVTEPVEPVETSPALTSPLGAIARELGSQAALMTVLPSDFPLPTLIRFVPDPKLKAAADEAARYAQAIEVKGPEGLGRADAALTTLRAAVQAIVDSFEEPARIANDLHKQITGTRGRWCLEPNAVLAMVGLRVAAEHRRLKAEADELRRKAQEEEDRKERERRRKEAEAAAAAQAPAPVVEEMKRQAETATAPPVSTPAAALPTLSGNTPTQTWKARVTGTPASDEPNPTIAEMSAAQRAKVLTLLDAIVRGAHPFVGIEVDWSYWNKRAKADKKSLDVPGLEAFVEDGLRAKPSRGRK